MEQNHRSLVTRNSPNECPFASSVIFPEVSAHTENQLLIFRVENFAKGHRDSQDSFLFRCVWLHDFTWCSIIPASRCKLGYQGACRDLKGDRNECRTLSNNCYQNKAWNASSMFYVFSRRFMPFFFNKSISSAYRPPRRFASVGYDAWVNLSGCLHV